MDTSTLAYLAAGAAALGLAAWRCKKRPDTFGSAGWLPAWTASGQKLFRKDGLLIGDWAGLLPVHYRGSGHALTVAPTGSGKGIAAIVPNLLSQPYIFLIDPGGENTAIAAAAWRRKGYAFYCLNPWSMHAGAPWSLPVHAFNPLDILDPRSATFASDAGLLAEMIVTRTGRDNGDTAFFKDEAESAIRAMLMHIATSEAPEKRTLLTLRQYLTRGAAEWGALLEDMKDNLVCGGVIAREAAQLERREMQAPGEFSAVQSTMKQDTNFIEDPVLQKALGESSADLAALKGMQNGQRLAGCVVSVVMPLEYYESHAAYARLIIGAALWIMQRPPLARGRVLFVMDEFPALNRMDRIRGGLATLRKYRVLLWPIIQNLGQLRSLYGNDWQLFIANAGMKQFIGAGDLETAQHVSALCGEGTVRLKPRGEARRPLATPEEITHMHDKLQIVLMDNLKPMLLRKTPYWERPELRGWFEKNPYHKGQTPGLAADTLLRAAQGQVLRLCAWFVRPAPAVIAAAAAAFIFYAEPGINTSGWRNSAGLNCNYITPYGGVGFKYPRWKQACPRWMLFGELWG